MKKSIILFVILNIFAINSLHSQWLEKEGYWELSEKIPDLRDLKILPEENLIITVSKDNTIRHIEYDSGKILKSGKPAELTDDNDYAKISSDGKTTVVARYKNGNTFTDIKVIIIDNYEFKDIATGIFPNGLENFESVIKNVEGLTITYCDFYSDELIFTNYITTKGNIDNGQFNTYGVVGNTFIASINNDSLVINKKFSKYSPFSLIKFSSQKLYHFAQIGYYKYSYSGSRLGVWDHSNALTLFDKDFDTTLVFNSEYSSKSTYDGQGSYSFTESGYLFPMNQLFESNTDSILIIRGDGKLYNFNLNQKKFIDSITNNIFQSNVLFISKNEFVGQLNLKKYTIYGKLDLRKLEEFALPNDVLLPYPIIDEMQNKTIFALKDQSIIYISFNILDDLSSKGFYWNKDSIYIGESISFKAITKLEGFTFEWRFNKNDSIITDSKEVTHTYMKAGVYGVTLDVIKPDGERISFVKDSIITVLEPVNADFETTVINNELPLKVQFTDKSTGDIKSWIWNFGDGEFSSEQNPVHEYKYQGDFSPYLIVSDGMSNDTLTIYESININSYQFELKNSESMSIIYQGKNKYLYNLVFSNGFSHIRTYDIFTGESYLDYKTMIEYFEFYNFNYNFLKMNNYTINSGYYQTSSVKENNKNNFIKISNDSVLFLNRVVGGNISIKNPDNGNSVFSKAAPGYNLCYNFYKSSNNDIFWIFINSEGLIVRKSDLTLSNSNAININKKITKQVLVDTIISGVDIINHIKDDSYSYFSISAENTLNYEKSFSLDTNITLTNIKSVNENLILMHGSYKDVANKTTYAYFAKYHPLDNTLQDTILYSRKDIRKIERVNNSTFAAIGQSRGRQGYLLLDTNLNQIKDIRVDSLTGEIKDMIIHNNKVYLFTEKIVSLPTMALGAKESYQTTASVLGLPEDIIASIEEKPIIFTDKLTHFAYPNPTNEVLNLKFATNAPANYTIKLYDIFGMEILNIHDGFIPANSEKIFSIPTSALPIGSYYYVISGGGLVDRGKILIIR